MTLEILGNGAEVESEIYSLLGSFVGGVIAILRQLVNYGYSLALWLIQQVQEHPLQAISGGLSMAILLA
jgi:hypothetical protein